MHAKDTHSAKVGSSTHLNELKLPTGQQRTDISTRRISANRLVGY